MYIYICGYMYVVVTVRFFIDTQNRLVDLHTVPFKVHEETDIRPRSVNYRPVGSTKQCLKKSDLPQGDLPRFYPYLRS
jgi:hypothetical protein